MVNFLFAWPCCCDPVVIPAYYDMYYGALDGAPFEVFLEPPGSTWRGSYGDSPIGCFNRAGDAPDFYSHTTDGTDAGAPLFGMVQFGTGTKSQENGDYSASWGSILQGITERADSVEATVSGASNVAFAGLFELLPRGAGEFWAIIRNARTKTATSPSNYEDRLILGRVSSSGGITLGQDCPTLAERAVPLGNSPNPSRPSLFGVPELGLEISQPRLAWNSSYILYRAGWGGGSQLGISSGAGGAAFNRVALNGSTWYHDYGRWTGVYDGATVNAGASGYEYQRTNVEQPGTSVFAHNVIYHTLPLRAGGYTEERPGGFGGSNFHVVQVHFLPGVRALVFSDYYPRCLTIEEETPVLVNLGRNGRGAGPFTIRDVSYVTHRLTWGPGDFAESATIGQAATRSLTWVQEDWLHVPDPLSLYAINNTVTGPGTAGANVTDASFAPTDQNIDDLPATAESPYQLGKVKNYDATDTNAVGITTAATTISSISSSTTTAPYLDENDDPMDSIESVTLNVDWVRVPPRLWLNGTSKDSADNTTTVSSFEYIAAPYKLRHVEFVGGRWQATGGLIESEATVTDAAYDVGGSFVMPKPFFGSGTARAIVPVSWTINRTSGGPINGIDYLFLSDINTIWGVWRTQGNTGDQIVCSDQAAYIQSSGWLRINRGCTYAVTSNRPLEVEGNLPQPIPREQYETRPHRFTGGNSATSLPSAPYANETEVAIYQFA